MKKLLFVNTVVLLLLVLVFDLAAFTFLPADYAWRFPDYRSSSHSGTGGRGSYPSGYFVRHETRGFDIGRNKSGRHWVNDVPYDIWSNSLGCFDREHTEFNRYVYFAGDSYTWGYTPYDAKFGSLIEQSSGTQVLKCGVTHTGQRHQYEKLSEIVEEIGIPPVAIFVFYFSNDVANDYAHPHTTVVNGWQVDNVSLDSNDEIIRHSQQELSQRIQSHLESSGENGASIGVNLKRYSLSINILDYLIRRLAEKLPNASKISKSLYALPQVRNGVYWYAENSSAKNNQASLLDFAKFSDDNSAELVVVLIPPAEKITDTNWYKEVRHFLTSHQIAYLDLTSKFEEKGLTSEDLYWPVDGHLNPAGNRILAEILLEEFPAILRQDVDGDADPATR